MPKKKPVAKGRVARRVGFSVAWMERAERHFKQGHDHANVLQEHTLLIDRLEKQMAEMAKSHTTLSATVNESLIGGNRAWNESIGAIMQRFNSVDDSLRELKKSEDEKDLRKDERMSRFEGRLAELERLNERPE